jgi:hypothetical protein
MGGRWVTSAEALARFLNATSGTDPDQPMVRTPTKRQKSSEEAMSFMQSELRQVKGSPRKRKTPRGNVPQGGGLMAHLALAL